MGLRLKHLSLVKPEEPHETTPPILTSEAARREFEELTQRLVDVAIEIVDLVDGDPDLEGDEITEDDDPLEGDAGV